MVAVKEITWEEASAPGFEQTTRQAWREAVTEIADKAKAKLPECAGRVDSAVKIVLAGHALRLRVMTNQVEHTVKVKMAKTRKAA